MILPTRRDYIAAIGGIVGAIAWLPTSFLALSIAHVLDPSSPARATAELSAHEGAAISNAVLFAIVDVGFALLVAGMSVRATRHRAGTAVGAALLIISSGLDVAAQTLVVAVTSGAPATLLARASSLDLAQGYFWLAGYVIIGVAMLGDLLWPRWLAWLAIINGLLAFPYLPIAISSWLGGLLDVIWMLGASAVLLRRPSNA